MSNGLPAQIDPIRLAEEGGRLNGRLSTRSMHRLLSLCASPPVQVVIDLQFERAGRNRWEMHGKVAGEVTLVCQRCLQPFVYRMDVAPQVMFARSDAEERHLSDDGAREVVLVTAPLVLSELIEDELLLGLPMIPMHADGVCAAVPAASKGAKDDTTARPNPFAVLGKLKKQDD